MKSALPLSVLALASLGYARPAFIERDASDFTTRVYENVNFSMPVSLLPDTDYADLKVLGSDTDYVIVADQVNGFYLASNTTSPSGNVSSSFRYIGASSVVTTIQNSTLSSSYNNTLTLTDTGRWVWSHLATSKTEADSNPPRPWNDSYNTTIILGYVVDGDANEIKIMPRAGNQNVEDTYYCQESSWTDGGASIFAVHSKLSNSSLPSEDCKPISFKAIKLAAP